MKQIFVAALLALLSTQSIAVTQGDVAPPWTGKDLITGESVDFPDVLGGKPAVILFWATWCPYCKAFMPRAAEIQAEYAEAGVQIISLNHKERGYGDAAAYAKSLGFPLVAIADADSIGDAWSIDFIPGLLVVDGEGNVAYRRRSTNLPAGSKVSQIWASEVRAVLDALLSSDATGS
ncbi:TlpA disulfide reductase family protein [Congregibacter brevis]|uniref:TlpA disulfide reductase family protein n=1 Tax=Congregibacter brevis TaxID=3081201 RepID=A0ABZ0IEM6_9GAMM|nr:TlpA disulfide reductase family protein [Congregibacter sp. IMCC45268]